MLGVEDRAGWRLHAVGDLGFRVSGSRLSMM